MQDEWPSLRILLMMYHSGEIEIQERAGVRHIAERKNDVYQNMPPIAQAFISQLPLLFLGGADKRGSVWASALFGRPGFVQSADPSHLQVNTLPLPGDPMRDCVEVGGHLATIGVDFASRRRMRTNGIVANRLKDDGFILSIQQVYSNCPKYIQAREWSYAVRPIGVDSLFLSTITGEAARLIAQSDTFFIASRHLDVGADVSHRGGMPGFVRIVDPQTLAFPDYRGNSMFNTLGNLAVSPQAGLLFLDFESGDLLQVSGTCEIDWSHEAKSEFTGAERMVRFFVEHARFVRGASPLTWRFQSYSPANPAML